MVSKLQKYIKKRHFHATPEPRPHKLKKKNSKPSSVPGFVIHKHAASRLHYDLRLEFQGVLVSWAIPKGPSMDPLVNRLSVHVEDHPLTYQEFEGVIPAGNYGAGTVLIWDNGHYSLEEAAPGETHDQTFARQFRKGSLKLNFSGQKLRGRFTLVKIKKSQGDDWLLIKKRDQYAQVKDILQNETSVASGRSLKEIGTAESLQTRKPKKKQKASVPGTVPGTLTTLLKNAPKKKIATGKPMQPESKRQSPETTHLKSHWLVQKVPPGMLAMVTIQSGEVEIRSTAGLSLAPSCAEIIAQFNTLPDNSVFSGVVSLEKKKYAMTVFDVLWFDGRYTADLPLNERWNIIKAIPWQGAVKLPMPLAAIAEKKAIGKLWYRKLSAPYAFNKRTDDWQEVVLRANHTTNSTTQRVASLTNPQKIFWPQEGFTKKDLYQYYQTIGPLMLPHIKDRPHSLNRHPNGIKGKSFFQKEVAGSVPGWIKTVPIAAYGGEKTINYVLTQDVESLLYLVNMGCIEINTWLSRYPKLAEPDLAVIDIDPGDLGFDYVLRSATLIRKLLDELEAISFCKTSGSRGLHIYLPIKNAAFADSQKFAESVGAYLLQKMPKLSSTDRSPLKRRNKVYIDALQNRKGQTMASIYSVRPKPGAPVSTPIQWEEVNNKLDPTKFTIKTVPRRIEKKGDLWEKIFANRNDLKKLHAHLQKLLGLV